MKCGGDWLGRCWWNESWTTGWKYVVIAAAAALRSRLCRAQTRPDQSNAV